MRARNDNTLLAAARPQTRIERIIDRVLIAASLLCVGGLIGAAAFGNQ